MIQNVKNDSNLSVYTTVNVQNLYQICVLLSKNNAELVLSKNNYL